MVREISKLAAPYPLNTYGRQKCLTGHPDEQRTNHEENRVSNIRKSQKLHANTRTMAHGITEGKVKYVLSRAT